MMGVGNLEFEAPSWTVMVWLRGLGLEQYEAVFRENEIDESVLPDLTEDHLRQLGLPLGARLKLLKAIAALGCSDAACADEQASTFRYWQGLFSLPTVTTLNIVASIAVSPPPPDGPVAYSSAARAN
jgi:hypothetical protein